ncbi:hypothetical protein [Streptomyces sp. NPDC050145]|uniref:hypothetical protein n=1 Tax=Streptomyces sp. NPDC050145 TaxID=3365602 RepID=UPI003792E38C
MPTIDLPREGLAAHGVYLCPRDSKHVGLARPRLLVMYRRGRPGLVFDVDAVDTIHQKVPGTRDTPAAILGIIRDGSTLEETRRPWTVFHLSEIGTIGSVALTIQQGRYLPVDHAYKALESGHLTVPTLDLQGHLRRSGGTPDEGSQSIDGFGERQIATREGQACRAHGLLLVLRCRAPLLGLLERVLRFRHVVTRLLHYSP